MPLRWNKGGIYKESGRYTDAMAKHLVDIDETVLSAAQAELGTTTMKETVNEALKRASAGRNAKVRAALDRLAKRDVSREGTAWR